MHRKMKTVQRIRTNGATKHTNSQDQNHSRALPKNGGAPMPPVSQFAENRALSAIRDMQIQGGAACALLLLLAEEMRNGAKNHGEWEFFNQPSFGKCIDLSFEQGILNLAGFVTANFQIELAKFSERINWILGKQPNPPSESKTWDFEDAVSSLRHCLELFGITLSNRRGEEHQIDHTTAFMMEERLNRFFDNLYEAYCAVLPKNRVEAAN
jgi:hypothetical protein